MGARQNDDVRRQKASVHVCPQFGFAVPLQDLGLKGGTTGLVTCPRCDRFGPVEIQIIDK